MRCINLRLTYLLPVTCTTLIAVDRLGSGVWVSASFQMFALTAGRCPKWGGNCLGGENVRGNMSEGEMSRVNVLHLQKLAITGVN